MVTVGVTGGIGSGKSTVCRVWEKMGADVVYADDLAKKLMTEDRELSEKIRSLFGNRSYNDDGSLNRKYLAREAFFNGRIEELNRIVHPAVQRRVKERIKQSEEKGTEMFVEEAALLLSKGRPPVFDFIVLVTASEDRRIGWVQKRDRSNTEDVMTRMKKQQPTEELLPHCDFVIENQSTLENLEKKAANLYSRMINFPQRRIDKG